MTKTIKRNETLEALREIAGGRGWLVEEAIVQQHHGSRDEISLPEVVTYILRKRLSENLDDETREFLEEELDEWQDEVKS